MTSARSRIVIADDEPAIREILSRLVRQEGWEPIEATDGEQALSLVESGGSDVLLLDIRMPGLDGMEVLRRAIRLDPHLPVVMITSNSTVKDAVAALRAGAHDYLAKPFDHPDVIRSLHGALTSRGLRRTVEALSEHAPEVARLREAMGESAAVSRVCADVARVACSNFTVLVTGETGTGKELVAWAIHRLSPRARAPLVALDCGAITEALFESELFGHQKGAFTGAYQSKPGKFEAAAGGTLFLDEICNMPLGLQAKLLRALQEHRVCRLGATHPVAVDCRVIAATNEDPETAAARGRLRTDLFFRLNEFMITIPPLRERKEDIALLAHRFLEATNRELGKAVRRLSAAAIAKLEAYSWPGNVRQLRSAVRRAALLADDVVELEHLGLATGPGTAEDGAAAVATADAELPLRQLVRRATAGVERSALLHALTCCGGNKAKAARLLEIDYKTMHNKLKEYGIRTARGEADVEGKG